jgi:hypothetical protein
MEMLVVITVGSVMLGIGVGMLHLLMRAEQTGRDRVYRTGVAARLAEQFREDAAAALRVMPEQENRPSQCRFVLAGDRIVTYRTMSHEVQRDERSSDKMVRQESYPLPDGRSAAVAVDRNTKPPLAKLIIANENGRELCIAARLGKDHRFTNASAGGQ